MSYGTRICMWKWGPGELEWGEGPQANPSPELPIWWGAGSKARVVGKAEPKTLDRFLGLRLAVLLPH